MAQLLLLRLPLLVAEPNRPDAWCRINPDMLQFDVEASS
jgi:hypothetical protein